MLLPQTTEKKFADVVITKFASVLIDRMQSDILIEIFGKNFLKSK